MYLMARSAGDTVAAVLVEAAAFLVDVGTVALEARTVHLIGLGYPEIGETGGVKAQDV